jgi:hypothetical protein
LNALLSDNLWPQLKRIAAKAAVKMAAVAYLTTDEFIAFHDGDLLIVDATDSAIATGETSAAVLARAVKHGAEVFSCPGLHAKVMVLGGTAVIGSANMSTTSATAKVEAAWVTDDPSAVSMAAGFIRRLAEQANTVDEKFLQRIKSIDVHGRRPRTGSRKRKGLRVQISDPRTWLVGVHPLKREFPEEEDAAEQGQKIAEGKKSRRKNPVSWIRWTGDSRFRNEAAEDDWVIQVWSDDSKKSPPAVYRRCRILLRQNEPSCTRFYLEQPADAEETMLPYKQFVRLAERVGIPGRIGASSNRLLKDEHAKALNLLWGE